MERESMEEGELITRSLLVEEINGREAVDDSSSLTAAVILSVFVASFASFAHGCASGYSSPAESGIMHDLGLSIAEYSTFGSIMTIGGVFGAIVSGKIADLIGRRGTMWFLEIFFIVGWLAIVFAEGAWWLNFGRLCLGSAAALQGYAVPIYIAEITPKNIRGGCAAAAQLTVAFGLSLMFSIGNLINWRTLAVVGAIPSLLQIVGLFFIPESPRWLAKIGKEKELEATLQWLRGKDADISKEAAEIKDYIESVQQLSKSRFLNLFERKYAHSLIVGVGIMLLIQFGGANGITFYASSIFEASGGLAGVGTTAMAIIQIPFSIVFAVLMDKVGRRWLLMVTATGACLGSLLTGLGFILQDLHQQKELTANLVFSGMLVYIASYSMGMAGTPWVIMSEILPINIKGSAGSLVTLANWSSSWIVSYAFNFLFEWSSAGVFFIFATMCCLIVVFVAMLVPETKGRTLEEIQASMIQLLP